MGFSTAGFSRVFPEKRLELKSLKGQTKADNGGTEGAPRGDGPSLKYNILKDMYISPARPF
jgi:hypothetical protein